MKLVIASDIHGSAAWCEKLMAEIKAFAPDRVILLGDLLYHGPRNPLPERYDPPAVAALLNSIASSVVAVRGNCDAEVDQMMLNFPCLAEYALIADGSPLRMFCTHGHEWGPEKLPPLMPGDVLASGHTHVKQLKRVALQAHAEDGVAPVSDSASDAASDAAFITLLNPGSVSLPKDGTNSFAVYEDGAFAFRTLR